MTRFDQIQDLFRTMDPFLLLKKRYDLSVYDKLSFYFILSLNEYDTTFTFKFKLKQQIKHLSKNLDLLQIQHKEIISILENDPNIEILIDKIKGILESPEPNC